MADLAWWEVFPDPYLVSHLTEALRNNNDLQAAAMRAAQAMQIAAATRSFLYPTVGYDAGAQADRGVFKQTPDLSLPAAKSQNLFLGGLSVIWEADLWGRIRNSSAAARAVYLETEEARRAFSLSLVSQVAQAYFEVLELDRRRMISANGVVTFEETRRLFSRRYGAGIASRLEQARADAALASAQASLLDVERNITLKENQISLLIGRNPGAVERASASSDPPMPESIPAGLPSDLLQRRPDLRAAEQLWIAANARIGIARSSFLPRVGLTTLLGRVSPELSGLASGASTVAALAGAIGGPIFTAGRLRNLERAAIASWEEQRANYAQAVLTAFREVADALTDYQKLGEIEEQQILEVQGLRDSVVIADRRYRGGLASYYEVLEAQQLLLPAQIRASQFRRDRLLAYVQIYKSLGGGWRLTRDQFESGRP